MNSPESEYPVIKTIPTKDRATNAVLDLFWVVTTDMPEESTCMVKPTPIDETTCQLVAHSEFERSRSSQVFGGFLNNISALPVPLK